MKQQLLLALACYVVLAVLGFFLLTGKMRLAVWILLASFALRTYLHSLRQE